MTEELSKEGLEFILATKNVWKFTIAVKGSEIPPLFKELENKGYIQWIGGGEFCYSEDSEKEYIITDYTIIKKK